MLRAALAATAVVLSAGCGVPAARFPSDVQAALAGRDMRRLETAQLVIYYPEGRGDVVTRMAARLEPCAAALRSRARIDNRHAREKMIVVVPEAPFNNAYVMPPAAGLEDVAVVPVGNSLDFATTFGLPPDPGFIGCHELVHYVQLKQIAGLWGGLRTVLGDLISPQIGFDAWFLEGLATYYEAQLQPAVGRPRWPVFTSMFHAAYAGGTLGEGDLSEQKRRAPVGHHYLVGTMFVGYLAETYGDAPLWRLVERQARSTTILFGINGHFNEVYGRSLGELFDEFKRATAVRYPVRARPAGERVVHRLGDDARWAWGPAGEVAAIDADVDAPARLRVWAADGTLLDSTNLVDVLPPRRQVIGAPLFVSGMAFAADGSLWFTSVDLGGTFQTTRLYRWRRGDGLEQVTSGLGPGGAIAPDARTYFHMAVDADRWSLAAHPLGGGPGRIVWNAAPGQYALRVMPSPDGARLAMSVWDGARFAVWVLDATTGARLAVHAAAAGPLYDPSWTPDGRLMLLDVVDGRFQVALVGTDAARTIVTDAPYGALEARAHGNAIRFLARDGWNVTLDEVAFPAPPAPPPPVEPAPPGEPPVPDVSGPPSRLAEIPEPDPAVATLEPVPPISDRSYSRLDGLFRPTLHTLAFIVPFEGSFQFGIGLGGGDRLDLIRWAAAAYVEPDTKKWSATGGVIWNDFAPWRVAVIGQRHAWTASTLAAPEDEDREWREGSVGIGRAWRGTYSAEVGWTYDYYRHGVSDELLSGPTVSLGYQAIEGTRYAGARRGMALQLDGTWFFGPEEPMPEARGQLDVYVPLPVTRRHVVHATVRGHALLDAPEPYLQVGGWSTILPLYSRPDELLDVGPEGNDRLPWDVRFGEPLRGFEDGGFLTHEVVLGDLSWTYPLIVDRGVTNLLFLPATFVSQIDLELFAAGAVLRAEGELDENLHAAAGASVALRLSFFRVPLTLKYQASRRITDDEGWLHIVGLGS